ncbi:RxLR effector protein [Phytophthora megakarya]|uniref:RxLR effector protein n=1 Tax=Phytophthora megakarya TaxID=4795 RepID=A0A225WLQ8_9STRA|nr:RxLR effector protein [Phytophthora megakarya]
MRVIFVFLAVIAISTVNAATNTALTTLSSTTSIGRVNSSDTDLGIAKRFLRKTEQLDKGADDDDEERAVLVKKTPSYMNIFNALRGKNYKTFSVTTEQLDKLNKGYTRDIFTNWLQQGHSMKTFQNTFKKLVKSNKISKQQYEDLLVWYGDVAFKYNLK